MPIRELTERTSPQFHEGGAALRCLPPTVEPRATEHIAEMILLIERLIAAGHAYAAEGHVLFHVPSMPDYGRLARRSLDEMIAGARVDVAPYKRDPMDFVLWKPSKEGEPAWPSPWGSGRPGWHIECSAMSWRHLGEVFDIHGGGIDLVFPHHENEVAQSRCAFHQPIMARYWMHNGYLQVEGEKMSKSLGNFVTIRELLNDWPGEVIRLAMLMTHYRQPINWTVQRLREATTILERWHGAVAAESPTPSDLPPTVADALCDDLNTPLAVNELHKLSDPALLHDNQSYRQLAAGGRFLGVLTDFLSWKSWRPKSVRLDEGQVEALVAARAQARKARNFIEADRIRDELAGMGVVLKDTPQGTTWEVAR